MRAILDQIFRTNLLTQAQVSESHPSKEHPVRHAVDGDGESFWEPENGGDSTFVTCSWRTPRSFDCAMLQEEIRLGQHVERFRVEQWNGSVWTAIARGGTIGEKRLLRFPLVTTRKVRFVIEQSRGPFKISALGLFRLPGKA
jgi:alpha-L-fucosidase